ncbi:MAG: MptD family putative ECF transporter S component [Actinomycetaceae bacterium]|nr:MptD family putative ECF transporter S component [Actinomycetaceae bacterium]
MERKNNDRRKKSDNAPNVWGIKEIVNVSLFGVLTGVMLFIGAFATVFNEVFSMIFSGPVGVLLAAPVYVMMVRRVDRFGVTSIAAIFIGLLFTLMGGYWYVFPWYVVVGVVVDVLWLRTPDMRRKAWNIIFSWGVFGTLYVFSTLIPIWVEGDKYFESQKTTRGVSESYVQAYQDYWTNSTWVIIIHLVALCASVLGAWFGTRMMRKHFEKASVL